MKSYRFVMLLVATTLVANLPSRVNGQQDAQPTPQEESQDRTNVPPVANDAGDSSAAGDSGVSTINGVETQRLPPGYSEIITNSQRRNIYRVQQRYQGQIDDLQRQIAALVASRDAEIGAVLDDRQRQVLQFILEIRERNRTEMEQAVSTRAGLTPTQANGPVATDTEEEDAEAAPFE